MFQICSKPNLARDTFDLVTRPKADSKKKKKEEAIHPSTRDTPGPS